MPRVFGIVASCYNSPLEQFAIVTDTPISLWCNYSLLVVSNFSLSLFWVAVLFGGLAYLIVAHSLPFFSRSKILLHFLFDFISLLSRENIVRKRYFFFNFTCVLFVFLVFANLLGMIPYSFALTSHFVLTFFLSFLVFFTTVTVGCQIHGYGFFGLFLPPGAPFFLAFFLIIIELISFVARLFSLAIRLFANIMSGHTLLKILAGFTWLLCFLSGGSVIGLAPFGIIFLITGLEILISLLQAYVFAVLALIYFNEAVILH